MTFADIIAPTSPETFTRSYLSTTYFTVSGHSERFVHLVPWTILNDVLVRFRTSGGRLSVVRNSAKIDASEYLRNPSDPSGTTIEPQALQRRLRLGDTLVLNHVHELFPEIQKIASSLERLLHIPVNANLYAGFRHSKGFDLHWDDHDTFILQIHGRKLWRIYARTQQYALTSHERPKDNVKPTTRPVWEGVLTAGDVLYMPRGWWHIAEPMNGPSLHVTFGFTPPTGLDLLNWILAELIDPAITRQPLPLFAMTSEQALYITALRQALSDGLANDVIAHYSRRFSSRIATEATLTLPEGVACEPLSRTTIVRLVGQHRLSIIQLSAHEVAFWSAGTLWRCDATLRPALECLGDQQGCSTEYLASRVPASDQAFLDTFLSQLVEAGALSTCHDAPQVA